MSCDITFQLFVSTAIHHAAENKQKRFFRLKKSQNKFLSRWGWNSCVYGVEKKNMWQQHWQHQRQQNTILIKAQWTHQIFKNTFWMIPSIHFFLSKSLATWQTWIIFTHTCIVRSICKVINYVKECSIKLTTDSFSLVYSKQKSDPGCYKRIIKYQHNDTFDKSLCIHTFTFLFKWRRQ